jgi:GNAT superfamily N-acetyltransferase
MECDPTPKFPTFYNVVAPLAKQIDRASMNPAVIVRFATVDDLSLVLSYIQKKSEFDRGIGAFSGQLLVSKQKLAKSLFCPTPFAYVLLAELSGAEVGFALYGFRYSSFVGQPSIWLDDLYVDQDQRSKGIGALLMAQLAQIAKLNDSTHLAWNADARNSRGLSFYIRLGAEVTEQQGNRWILRWLP